MISQIQISIFCGPTSSGKTHYSISEALRVGGEIINCDMAQLYSSGKIATAQISVKDRCGIPHHLLGFIDKPYGIDVYQMRCLIEKKIFDIYQEKGRVPIFLVGGSIFCIYSLFFAPLNFYLVQRDFYLNHFSIDIFRDMIAFDAFRSTKKLQDSENKMFFGPIFDYTIFHIDVSDRLKWRKMISSRIGDFCEKGLLKEINDLSIDWKDFFYRKKIIGYYEILKDLKKDNDNMGCVPFDVLPKYLCDEIFYRTCQYGKRQRTYGKKLLRDSTEFKVVNKHILF